MSTEPEDGPQEFDGPDPRTWRGDPELWGLVEDIRAIDEVLSVLQGEVAQVDRGPARREARAYLTEAGYQRREVLARALLEKQCVPVPEEAADASPFGAAGKPRAFGADRSKPAPEPKA